MIKMILPQIPFYMTRFCQIIENVSVKKMLHVEMLKILIIEIN